MRWITWRTARAKGIGHFLVINKHALRNALLPIVTVIGMQIPTLFGGAVIIEQIFSWPGLGMITMTAITGRDYPVVMAVCLLSAVWYRRANLLTVCLRSGRSDHQVLRAKAYETTKLPFHGVAAVLPT